jgi:hypothetical protein
VKRQFVLTAAGVLSLFLWAGCAVGSEGGPVAGQAPFVDWPASLSLDKRKQLIQVLGLRQAESGGRWLNARGEESVAEISELDIDRDGASDYLFKVRPVDPKNRSTLFLFHGHAGDLESIATIEAESLDVTPLMHSRFPVVVSRGATCWAHRFLVVTGEYGALHTVPCRLAKERYAWYAGRVLEKMYGRKRSWIRADQRLEMIAGFGLDDRYRNLTWRPAGRPVHVRTQFIDVNGDGTAEILIFGWMGDRQKPIDHVPARLYQRVEKDGHTYYRVILYYNGMFAGLKLLPSSSNGFRDLELRTPAGAEFRFDGKEYRPAR